LAVRGEKGRKERGGGKGADYQGEKNLGQDSEKGRSQRPRTRWLGKKKK